MFGFCFEKITVYYLQLFWFQVQLLFSKKQRERKEKRKLERSYLTSAVYQSPNESKPNIKLPTATTRLAPTQTHDVSKFHSYPPP